MRFNNRQTSGVSASLPQYDEGTISAEVATSGVLIHFITFTKCLKIVDGKAS
jgi:hypothetical protein